MAIVLPPHILKLSTCSVSQFLPLWKKKSKQASFRMHSGGIIRRPEVLSPLFQASWWTWVSAWLLWPSGSVPSKWRLESDPLCVVAPSLEFRALKKFTCTLHVSPDQSIPARLDSPSTCLGVQPGWDTVWKRFTLSDYVHSAEQDSDLFNLYLVSIIVGKCRANVWKGIKKGLYKPLDS